VSLPQAKSLGKNEPSRGLPVSDFQQLCNASTENFKNVFVFLIIKMKNEKLPI